MLPPRLAIASGRSSPLEGHLLRLAEPDEVNWPAAGLVDTKIGCFMKPEVRNATQEALGVLRRVLMSPFPISRPILVILTKRT
jgi:hypothetical protein